MALYIIYQMNVGTITNWINRETKSEVNQEANGKKKNDNRFYLHHYGQELGCGEAKKINTDSNLERNRACICETMKKQLRIRTKYAKDVQEFVSFGIFTCKKQIKL